ncbi:MAG TPA: hypothetical protein VGN57_10490 [Pirellulaceae bacterium]|nr:hypothetical protein [Pirellulaceae bacterium]
MANPYEPPGAEGDEGREDPEFNAVVALIFYGACALGVLTIAIGTVAYAAALLWQA